MQSDPSGNYSGWQATVIGANNTAGKSYLKNEYNKDDVGEPTVEEALKMAVKTLNKTMDAVGTTADKFELFYFKYNEDDEKCSAHTLTTAETKNVLDAVEAESAAAGDS